MRRRFDLGQLMVRVAQRQSAGECAGTARVRVPSPTLDNSTECLEREVEDSRQLSHGGSAVTSVVSAIPCGAA